MEKEYLTDNKEYLHKHGIKNTKQRNLIFNILSQTQTMMSAEDIFLELRTVDDSINLSTVYRILELFTLKGITAKTNLPDTNKCIFELNQLEHKHHLICLKCKKIIYIKDCPLHDFERQVEQQTQFNITKHKLEMYGYCNHCNEI